MLLTRGTNQPTLTWQTNLRPNLGNHSAWKLDNTPISAYAMANSTE